MAHKSSRQPSLGQTIIWRTEAVAYDMVSGLLSLLSFDHVSAMGGWLLRHIGPLTRKHAIARRGLTLAFPELDERQIQTLLKAQWDNIGRNFAEFPILHRLNVKNNPERVTITGLEHLQARIKSQKPAVIVTGHFANWEIMAMVLTQYGLPVQITYRRINNPYIDRRVRQQRQAYGAKLLVPKSGAKGAAQLIDALNKGESIALLNDQKFNQGLAVPFFGVNAMTAPGPTRLALKANVPILPLSLTRQGACFTMTIHEPIQLENTGERLADTEAGVKTINAFLEARIRDNPEQWFWVHRRWPKSHYNQDKPTSVQK